MKIVNNDQSANRYIAKLHGKLNVGSMELRKTVLTQNFTSS
jgi:hypothetical protein